MFARMEKAADSQKQKEAVPTRRPPENPMPVRSFYSMNPQNAPIQMLRKLVVDKPDKKESIFWDKRVGKYFTGMTPAFETIAEYAERYGVPSEVEPTVTSAPEADKSAPQASPVRVPQTVDNAEYDKENNEFTFKPSEKTRIGLNTILVELNGHFFVQPWIRNPQIYSNGEALPDNRVFSMRFYAEGDMRHATGVARGLQSGTARARQIRSSLSPLPFPRGSVSSGVISPDPNVHTTVKATEFRTHEDVSATYGFAPETLAAGLANFEGSFGGRTGDMTQTPSAGFKRRYNLIQATFFWIPKTDIQGCKKLFPIKDQLRRELFYWNGSPKRTANREAKLAEYKRVSREIENCELTVNKDMFEKFLLNKAQKLTDSGELRVVVAGGDIYMDAVEQAADKAAVELKDYIKDYIDLRSPKKYSSILSTTGLNPGEQFKHTRTATNDEVPATTRYGDVIYVFRRKSPDT